MIAEQNPIVEELEDLAEQLTYNPEKFAHKILLENGSQKSLLFAFMKGQELKTHTTPKPALLVILQGICSFHINDNTQTLSAGEVFIIPAHVPHALSAITNFKMVLIK